MMAHTTFVTLSYSISAIVLGSFIVNIFLDGRRQKKQLSKLEALGLAQQNKKTKQ